MKQIITYVTLALLLVAPALVSGIPAVQASTSSCYTFNTNHKVGSSLTSAEAAALKSDLVNEGLWSTGVALTSYNATVAKAVTTFQEKYSSDILAPNGMTAGNGFFGASTRAKMNSLYGCAATTASSGSASGSGTGATASAVQCPTGMICTPIAQTNAFVCPTGYTCTLATANPTPTPTPTSDNSSQLNQQIGQLSSGGSSAYSDYLCSSGICNNAASTSVAIPDVNTGPIVYQNPNESASPSSLYGAGTDASGNIVASTTLNRNAPGANTTFNPDTWVLNPAGQYYGFPCKNVGCIKPSAQNQTTVAKLVATIVGNSCNNEISFETAQAQAGMYQGGLSSVVNPSTLHLKAAEANVEYSDFYGVGPFWPQTASLSAPFNPEVYDLCLDAGYVSNVPAGFDKTKIIALNTPKTQAIIIPIGPTMSASDYTISATYNVTAPYGKCVYYCGNNHVVNKSVGPQPVTVSIIKFNNISTSGITAGEAIFRLLSLGYRPAVVDEITAIQSQAGDGIPYLGDSTLGPAYDLDGYAGLTVTSSKCPGVPCSNTSSMFIFPGDKIAAVKL